MRLTGFRDPFIFQQGGHDSTWKLILGSGVKDKGGTILLYHSKSASTGTYSRAMDWALGSPLP